MVLVRFLWMEPVPGDRNEPLMERGGFFSHEKVETLCANSSSESIEREHLDIFSPFWGSAPVLKSLTVAG